MEIEINTDTILPSPLNTEKKTKSMAKYVRSGRRVKAQQGVAHALRKIRGESVPSSDQHLSLVLAFSE